MSPYGLELVYKYSWAPEDGGGKASGVTDDRTYQEIYNTTLWDQMLQVCRPTMLLSRALSSQWPSAPKSNL